MGQMEVLHRAFLLVMKQTNKQTKILIKYTSVLHFGFEKQKKKDLYEKYFLKSQSDVLFSSVMVATLKMKGSM